jgi:hypothetical protein
VEKRRFRLEKERMAKDLQEVRQATNDYYKFICGGSDNDEE